MCRQPETLFRGRYRFLVCKEYSCSFPLLTSLGSFGLEAICQ